MNRATLGEGLIPERQGRCSEPLRQYKYCKILVLVGIFVLPLYLYFLQYYLCNCTYS